MSVELVYRRACQKTEQINVIVETSECIVVQRVYRRQCTNACLAYKEAFLRKSIIGVPHLDESVSRCRNELLIFAGGIQSDLVFHVKVYRCDFLLVGSIDCLQLIAAELGQQRLLGGPR
jgi:hypothetical protein